ncbi:hypothetical protein FQA39_LY14464 [Lamprigera yunnana]|nr:hypothetical protein FQA39_LY14464 [Lamprigera yunnana]
MEKLVIVCIAIIIPCALSARYVPKWKKQACEIPTSQNEHSHYVCDDDGEVKCLPGWTGDLCDVPKCRPGCDPLNGYCERPGECLCKLGFYGEKCNKCIPLPGCRNGYCNASFECSCHRGWDGLFCSDPICLSECHTTRGYCDYPGECKCRLGWSGKYCKDCQVLPGCQRGFCTKPLECKCYPGYTGILCQIPICSATCDKKRGYCRRPGECRCKVGWWGKNCHKCYPYPGCVNGGCDVRGNAIVNLDGVECFAMKISLVTLVFSATSDAENIVVLKGKRSVYPINHNIVSNPSPFHYLPGSGIYNQIGLWQNPFSYNFPSYYQYSFPTNFADNTFSPGYTLIHNAKPPISNNLGTITVAQAVTPKPLQNKYVATSRPLPYSTYEVEQKLESLEPPMPRSPPVPLPAVPLAQVGRLGSGSLGYTHLGNGLYALGSGSLGYRPPTQAAQPPQPYQISSYNNLPLNSYLYINLPKNYI